MLEYLLEKTIAFYATVLSFTMGLLCNIVVDVFQLESTLAFCLAVSLGLGILIFVVLFL